MPLSRNQKIALGVGGGAAALGLGAWAWSRRGRERPALLDMLDMGDWPIAISGTRTASPIDGALAASLRGLLVPGEGAAMVQIDPTTNPAAAETVRGMARGIAIRMLCKFENRVAHWTNYAASRPCTTGWYTDWANWSPDGYYASGSGRGTGRLPRTSILSSGKQMYRIIAGFGDYSDPPMPANLRAHDLMAFDSQTEWREGYEVSLCDTGFPFWAVVIGHRDDDHFDRWAAPSRSLTYSDAYGDLFDVYNPRSALVRELASGRPRQTPTSTTGWWQPISAADVDEQGTALLMGYPFLSQGARLLPVGPALWGPQHLDVSRMVDFYVRDWIACRMMDRIPARILEGADRTRYLTCYSIPPLCFLAAAALEMGLVAGPDGDIEPALGVCGSLLWERLRYVPPPSFSWWSVFAPIVMSLVASFAAGPLGAAAIGTATGAVAGAIETARSAMGPIVNFAVSTLGASIVRGGLVLNVGPPPGLQVTVGANGDFSVGVHGYATVSGNLAGGEWIWDAPAVGYPNDEIAAGAAYASDWRAAGHIDVPGASFFR